MKSKSSVTIESKKSSEIQPTSDKSLPQFDEEKKSNNSVGFKHFEKNQIGKNNKTLFDTKEKIRSEIFTKKDMQSNSGLQKKFSGM